MLIDITQELFSCRVFPGDAQPEKRIVSSIGKGDICNLTAFSMCAHNGTHVDAPFHFLDDGKTINRMDLSAFVGACAVLHRTGILTAEHAAEIVQTAQTLGAPQRILLAGEITVTEDAAQVFAQAALLLLGVEDQTVGSETVHRILLGAETVLLEGAVLSHVAEGKYDLSAAPLNLGGCDGAPCRAYLRT